MVYSPKAIVKQSGKGLYRHKENLQNLGTAESVSLTTESAHENSARTGKCNSSHTPSIHQPNITFITYTSSIVILDESLSCLLVILTAYFALYFLFPTICLRCIHSTVIIPYKEITELS